MSTGAAQYAHVPPPRLLGAPSVRCARCHVVLRPGQERAIEIDRRGVVRCVECSVPALRRALAEALSQRDAAHALIRETCDATDACFAAAVKGSL